MVDVPNTLVVGCVVPNIELVAGVVDSVVPNGVAAAVVATAPNIFVAGAGAAPNVNGFEATGAGAGKKSYVRRSVSKKIELTEWTRCRCTRPTE